MMKFFHFLVIFIVTEFGKRILKHQMCRTAGKLPKTHGQRNFGKNRNFSASLFFLLLILDQEIDINIIFTFKFC